VEIATFILPVVNAIAPQISGEREMGSINKHRLQLIRQGMTSFSQQMKSSDAHSPSTLLACSPTPLCL
jgi:hypothetical protein